MPQIAPENINDGALSEQHQDLLQQNQGQIQKLFEMMQEQNN